jgi:hypothetical protein
MVNQTNKNKAKTIYMPNSNIKVYYRGLNGWSCKIKNKKLGKWEIKGCILICQKGSNKYYF